MNNQTIIKKKNNSFLGVRVYAENLGFILIKEKRVNKNNRAYNFYCLYDNKGILIAEDRQPKVIREKLDLINTYRNMNN